jgi:thioredoxin-related protein
MRRVVTALVLVMMAVALAACSSSTSTESTTSTTTATVATSGSSVTAATTATGTDVLSPTQVVASGEMFPTDSASVPQAILDNIAAGKPMLVFFYDPTTKVTTDERKAVNATIKKYRGQIELMAFDYTRGLDSDSSDTTLSANVSKIELLANLLKINTTPYIVFVDAYGRITYRFAGYTDHVLLEREALRATE